VLMAGSLMASIPMIILFLIFQRNMIQGIAAGAVKG
jgi:multiple sugar transport system permease protein